ncbi:MAG: hypothetical protein ABW275_12000, partial [Hansschlegelia sp.]
MADATWFAQIRRRGGGQPPSALQRSNLETEIAECALEPCKPLRANVQTVFDEEIACKNRR